MRPAVWEVSRILHLAAREQAGAYVRYVVHVRNDNWSGTLTLVQLKAVCGPGD
jgi:hypothetical protein